VHETIETRRRSGRALLAGPRFLKGAVILTRRTLVAFAAVSLLIGAAAVPATAARGGPARYQLATTLYTVAVLDTFTHAFVVTANPCDGSIAISGATPVDGGYYTTETISGTLANGVISFDATYDGPYSPGFAWSGSFPVGGGPLSGSYTGTVTAGPTTHSSFKNHGAYVSSAGGGRDAAHSCIGMPMRAHDDATPAAPPSAKDDSSGRDIAAFATRLAANEARLLATLKSVLARLQATAKANAHAIAAIQKHVDALAAGETGLDRASKAVGGNGGSKDQGSQGSQGEQGNHGNSGSRGGSGGHGNSGPANAPDLPDPARDHPGKGDHPDKP
jgi:hypothetical protein